MSDVRSRKVQPASVEDYDDKAEDDDAPAQRRKSRRYDDTYANWIDHDAGHADSSGLPRRPRRYEDRMCADTRQQDPFWSHRVDIHEEYVYKLVYDAERPRPRYEFIGDPDNISLVGAPARRQTLFPADHNADLVVPSDRDRNERTYRRERYEIVRPTSRLKRENVPDQKSAIRLKDTYFQQPNSKSTSEDEARSVLAILKSPTSEHPPSFYPPSSYPTKVKLGGNAKERASPRRQSWDKTTPVIHEAPAPKASYRSTSTQADRMSILQRPRISSGSATYVPLTPPIRRPFSTPDRAKIVEEPPPITPTGSKKLEFSWRTPEEKKRGISRRDKDKDKLPSKPVISESNFIPYKFDTPTQSAQSDAWSIDLPTEGDLDRIEADLAPYRALARQRMRLHSVSPESALPEQSSESAQKLETAVQEIAKARPSVHDPQVMPFNETSVDRFGVQVLVDMAGKESEKSGKQDFGGTSESTKSHRKAELWQVIKEAQKTNRHETSGVTRGIRRAIETTNAHQANNQISGNNDDADAISRHLHDAPDLGPLEISTTFRIADLKQKSQYSPGMPEENSVASGMSMPGGNDDPMEALASRNLVFAIVTRALVDADATEIATGLAHKLRNDCKSLLMRFASRFRKEMPSVDVIQMIDSVRQNESLIQPVVEQILHNYSSTESKEIVSEPAVPNEYRMREWLEGEQSSQIEPVTDLSVQLASLPLKSVREHPSVEKYTRCVYGSASYQWLVGKFGNLTLLTEASILLKDTIEERISSAIARRQPAHVSDPDVSHKAFFQLLLPLRSEDLKKKTKSVGSILTITGSDSDAQALTCKDYVNQTWPSNGVYMIDLIDQAIVLEPGQSTNVVRSDATILSALRKNSTMEVRVVGIRDIILEIAEQVAWITAALNAPRRGKGRISCSPLILLSEGSRQPVTNEDEDEDIKLDITVDYRDVSTDSGPGLCWHSLFDRYAIIEGFPIRNRNEPSLGLELALNMILWLMDTKYLQRFAGSVFIKNFSTILRPIKRSGSFLIWHLSYSEGDDPIPYLENGTSEPYNISLESVLNFRHVIGWCSNVKNHCGAADIDYNIERSMTRLCEPNGVLYGCDLAFGNEITGGNDFVPTRNHKPAARIRKTYIDMFRYLEKKFVLFWDTRDLRGWLINGLQALLHLIRQSLKIDRDEDASGEMFVMKPEDLEEPQNANDEGAARVFLSNLHNLRAKLSVSSIGASHEEYEVFADRLQQFYDVVEKGFNYQRRYKEAKCIPRSCLEGWDFTSLALKEDSVEPSMYPLPSAGKGWVDFTRGLGAITLFGEGFGDLLESEQCGGVPCNNYYMACSIPTIRQIMVQARSNLRSTPRMISHSPRIMWYSPAGSIEDHKCKSSKQKSKEGTETCNNTQVQVMWPREYMDILPDQGDTPDLTRFPTGAVIFGHNTSLTHYIPDLGPPVPGPLPNPDQELDLFEDSGLGSSISGKRTDTASQHSTDNNPLLSPPLPSPPMMALSPTTSQERQAQQLYGNSSISGGFTVLGNVHGNLTVYAGAGSPLPEVSPSFDIDES